MGPPEIGRRVSGGFGLKGGQATGPESLLGSEDLCGRIDANCAAGGGLTRQVLGYRAI